MACTQGSANFEIQRSWTQADRHGVEVVELAPAVAPGGRRARRARGSRGASSRRSARARAAWRRGRRAAGRRASKRLSSRARRCGSASARNTSSMPCFLGDQMVTCQAARRQERRCHDLARAETVRAWTCRRPSPPPASALHAVAEHVLAAARYRAVGRIGLVVRAWRLRDARLRRHGAAGRGRRAGGRARRRRTRRAPLTTLRAAGAFVGIEPACRPRCTSRRRRSTSTSRWPSTRVGGHRPGRVVRPRRRRPAGVRGRRAAEPTSITLWPEHFDLALTAAEVNYGVLARRRRHRRALRLRRALGTSAARRPGVLEPPFGATLGTHRGAQRRRPRQLLPRRPEPRLSGS